MGSLVAWLQRRRVTLGFVAAAATIVLAQPTWGTWRAGLIVAALGAAFRVWAAGHLEKSREVTRSGPYRWTRHPLYVGSGILALGVVIASRSVIVAILVAIYIAATYTAAVRSEEAFLERMFGDTYAQYRQSASAPMQRRFSLERAWRNREYRALAGLAGGFGLLALKILLPI